MPRLGPKRGVRGVFNSISAKPSSVIGMDGCSAYESYAYDGSRTFSSSAESADKFKVASSSVGSPWG